MNNINIIIFSTIILVFSWGSITWLMLITLQDHDLYLPKRVSDTILKKLAQEHQL